MDERPDDGDTLAQRVVVGAPEKSTRDRRCPAEYFDAVKLKVFLANVEVTTAVEHRMVWRLQGDTADELSDWDLALSWQAVAGP
ncbi:hypothetical protein AWC29_12875 [Mycobacterium triplex]|uniref:Uncharacterized protein n=1 Tax=Mycobacterium triplex TaxID=47839 RepID=A0ABX3W5Q9_9MYCO|nr:hypothetical protein AWC29_12875 [Mycobacterium triplex]